MVARTSATGGLMIVGTNSVSLSNVCDLVQSDQHAHAMLRLRKQHTKFAGLPPSTYSAIKI